MELNPDAQPVLRRSYAGNGISLLLLILVIAGAAYYFYERRPCGNVITYRIGSFDTRFGLSKEEFIADMAQAADLWNQTHEEAGGGPLLEYSASGTMPVNLIYDQRQQLAVAGASIKAQQSQNESTKSSLNADNVAYQQEEQAFLAQKQSFTAENAAYEAQVAKVNAAGGATPEQGAALDAERAKLLREQDSINAQAQALNQKADSLKTRTDTLNASIDKSNQVAQSYDTQAGGDFDEGLYVYQNGAAHIDIYEYQTKTQLLRVLAHEFGHSLGLAHDTGTESIMNPYNFGTAFMISPEDKAELSTECAFPQNILHSLLPSMM